MTHQLVVGDVELARQDKTASLGFGFQSLLLGVGVVGKVQAFSSRS